MQFRRHLTTHGPVSEGNIERLRVTLPRHLRCPLQLSHPCGYLVHFFWLVNGKGWLELGPFDEIASGKNWLGRG